LISPILKMIKKVVFSMVFFLIFASFSPRFTTDVQAACGGSGYSSCPVAKIGPKIVYTAESDFQTVRERYDNAGWSGYQIPTLILIPAQAFVEDPSYVQGIIQNMANQGLVPYIRISGQLTEAEGQWVWQPLDTQTAYTAGQVLNSIFSEFTGQFGGQQRVFLYNEPNLSGEMGNLGLEERIRVFAETTAAFIEGLESEGVRNIKLYFPPMALQSGTEQQFIQQALALLQEHFGKNKFDGAALTLYGADTQALQNLFNTVTNYFPGQFDFFISEIGPLINGKLLLSESQAQAFADFLTQVFRLKLSDPNFLAGVSGITTSFFVDTDGDGDPDETWLVVIDKDGNVTVLRILSGENPYLGSGRAETCPNIDVGHVQSCGEGFVLKVPRLFIPFLGNIAQLIFPKIENMPSWLRQWAKYERENPIDRLHPPQESDEAEELFRTRMEETAWTDSKTFYAWYDLDTGKGGTTEGNPEYPETSNNALRPPYKTTGYLWGLMQPPTPGQPQAATETGQTLSFEDKEYPINLTEAGEDCAITIDGIQTIGADGKPGISFTVGGRGSVIKFNDINYEVYGPDGKIGCGGILPQAGGVPTRVTCPPPAYKLKENDLITIEVFDHQVSAEQCAGNETAVTIAVGKSTPEGEGGSSLPGCAVYGVSGSPQEQPCIAGSCQLPTSVAHRVFEKIFDALGELIEKIPIGWATTAHQILFVPQLLYPSNLVGVYKNGTAVYNSMLPPNIAESAPEPAVAEANKHTVDLGPFQIVTLFQSRHKVPLIGRPYLEKEKFLQFLEPPNQTL